MIGYHHTYGTLEMGLLKVDRGMNRLLINGSGNGNRNGNGNGNEECGAFSCAKR